MSGIAILQGGQSDLELAGVDTAVLLAPYTSTSPLTTLEDATIGGLDAAKIGASSPFVTVGNYEKKAGVKLSNKPTLNKIMSAGRGTPTRLLFSEAEKGIAYTPQETNLTNLQNAWGFTPDAVSAPSTHGGITIGIPELPTNILWRCVLLAWDTFGDQDIFQYWIANKVAVGDRNDISLTDSDVTAMPVQLYFLTDNAVRLPVIYGACGDGFQSLNTNNNTGLVPESPAVTGITVAPTTLALTAAAGGGHTGQLTVTDSNGVNQTGRSTFATSAPSKATVSSSGLVTAVAAGTATITAEFDGDSATCAVTVS